MIKKNTSMEWFRNLGLLLLILGVALVSTTVPAQVKGTAAIAIENFGQVNERYYRGGQPEEQDIEQLKRMGIKTVIDLRQDKKHAEADWVKRAGMQYFNIPLKASRAATEEQTSYFLSLVNDSANWPVYVHCKGGRHRTGALTAVYRISNDGWTADQAFAEMKKYDFNDSIFGGPGAQKKFVYSFYQRYVGSQAKK